MMISYPGLSKPKFKQVLYHNVILANDAITLEQLKDLSCKRKAIEESISNGHLISEAIAREISGGLTSRFAQDIQKIELYLPLLENLIRHVTSKGKNRQIMTWISDLKIRWSSVLTSSSILPCHSPKFYQINDIYFELGMTLFLYGSLLRERALEVLSSDLVQSAALFRKAAGVYTYIAQEVLINIQSTHEKPPEVTSSVCSIMSLICLAEAQAVTARKGEENGKSEGLLAKLQYGVKEFIDEAIDIFSVVNKERKDMSSRFLDFIVSCKILHELTSYKHLAKALKNEDKKIGDAIGVLRWALSNAKKNVPKENSSKLVYKQVINEMSELLRKYERENEFVSNEKIPRTDELPTSRGVKIVNILPYEPQKWETTLSLKV